MKTLLERLKPEFRAKLNLDDQVLIPELLLNYNWLDLRYWVVCDLVDKFNLPDYNPSTISDLFDNE